jgi:hypothetical protein
MRRSLVGGILQELEVYPIGRGGKVNRPVLLRNAALAGMIGPALFALIVVVLTVAQYGSMVDLGWDPIGASDVPWPSGLALGPLGWLQVVNFILLGLALMVFAVGLHRGVAARVRGSVIGPVFLVAAGVALVLSAFKTDPSLSGSPQSWHGLIHGLAFLLLVLSLLLSLLFLWWRLRRDPLWRGYDLYTIITAVLYVVFFLSASQWAFYLFLAVRHPA